MAGMSDLVFDIFAIDRASAVFSRVGASADATAAKVERGSAVMSQALLGAGAVALGLGLKSIQMAASFDASMTRLTTTAGESQSNMKMVSQGVLDMAGKVGYSAQELATAMYQVESGGFHGAQALNVLKVAAEGARVEGANVTDVSHALAGALNDYAGTSLTAVEATNAMTAAVGHGMMTFQDLAEAMPKIGARAAAARVTFSEMTAALGTMTRDGLPATVAATYLGQTIGQLAAPTAKARLEMKGLGIDSTSVAQTITSGSGHGLGDALKMLYDGIQNHLVGGGLVSVDTFKKMSKSTTDYQQVLAKLPPNLQTNIQALATMAGGVKAFQGVLMLGGAHAQQYADTLGAVNGQIKKGGNDVAGFADAQKNLATQWADLKGAASALGVEIGNDLMPAALGVTHAFQDMFGWMQNNKGTVEAVGIGVVGLAGAFTVLKVAELGVAGVNALMSIGAGASMFALSAEALAAGEATVAFEALGLALDATPFGMVAMAIGGLTLGIAALVMGLEGADKPTAQVRDLQGILNTKFRDGIGPLRSLNVEAYDYADALGKVGGQLKIVNTQQALTDALRGAKVADKHTGLTPLDAAATLGIPEMQLAKMLSGQGKAALADLQQQYDNLKNSTQGYLTTSQTLAAKALSEAQQAAAAPHNVAGARAAQALQAQANADQALADSQKKLYDTQNPLAQAMLTVLGAATASGQKIKVQTGEMVNAAIQTATLKGSMDGLNRSLGNGFTVGEEVARSLSFVTNNAAANKTNIDNLVGSFSKFHMSSGEVAQALSDLGIKGTALGDAVTVGVKRAEAGLAQLPAAVTDQGNAVQAAGIGLGNMADQGFANGLTISLPAVTNAASLVADRAVNKMREVLQIHSPSKKTQQIGEYVVDGLVVGMTRSQHLAEVAAKNIATAMHKSLMQGLRVEQLELGYDLAAANAKVSKDAAAIKAAQAWGQGFLGNVFTQGFTPGGATTATTGTSAYTSGGTAYALTGLPVTTGGPTDIVSQMIAYQQKQANDAATLNTDVITLRQKGLAGGLLDQLQQGGASSLPEIEALAKASATQIATLSGLFAVTNTNIGNAGAEATAGTSLASLKAQQAKDDRQVAVIKKAMKDVKFEIVGGGKKLRVV